MRAERQFVSRGLMLVGFTLGLAFGRVTAWPWWCYLATVISYTAAIVLMACWSVWREPRLPADAGEPHAN